MLLSAPFAMQAFTVEQLVGKKGWTETIFTNAWNDKKIDACGGVTLVAVSDTEILIKGFKEGTGNLLFTLVDDNGNVTKDGTMLSYKYDDASGDNVNSLITGVEYKLNYVSGYGNIMSYNMGRDYYDNPYVPYWRGRIKEDGNGNFTIAFPEGINNYSADKIVAVAATKSNTYKDDGGHYISKYYLNSYDANATASDTKYEYNSTGTRVISTTSREYPVMLDLKDDNTFTILNFCNKGNAINKDEQTVLITGTYDLETGKFTIDPNQYATIWHAWSVVKQYYTVVGATVKNYNCQVRSMTSGKVRSDIIEGTITPKGVHHNSAEEGWVTNDGRRKTYENYHITIPGYTHEYLGSYPALPYGWTTWANRYDNTNIETDDDYTVDVELNLEKFQWHTEDGIYVECSVVTNANDRYVDHYDVMLVKGHYNSINDADFRHHVDKGHEEAIEFHVPSVAKQMVSRSDNGEEKANDYSLKKLMNVDELGHNPVDGEYTLFVRTNYKPETGLTPTFHSLQYVEAQNPTAIDEVYGDSDAKTDDVIYNINGVRVKDASVPGFYIIGGRKVFVR